MSRDHRNFETYCCERFTGLWCEVLDLVYVILTSVCAKNKCQTDCSMDVCSYIAPLARPYFNIPQMVYCSSSAKTSFNTYLTLNQCSRGYLGY